MSVFSAASMLCVLVGIDIFWFTIFSTTGTTSTRSRINHEQPLTSNIHCSPAMLTVLFQ
jgi:hypothetical protein